MNTDDRELHILAERAADWVEKLPQASPEEREQFVTWLRACPRHIHEMLVACAWDEALDHLDPRREIDIDALIASLSDNVVLLPSGVPRPAEPIASHTTTAALPPPSRRRSWAQLGKVGAVVPIALAIVAGAVMTWMSFQNDVIETDAGEWQSVTLVDGSFIRVAPDSRLELSYTKTRRGIHLNRGRAMFYVAKDAARPFLVETEIATARAVGTAFAVTRIESDGSVLVTVREGAVAVSKAIPRTEAVDAPENAMRGQPARVSAGEQAAVNRTASIHVQPVNVEQALDWAMESLVLRGTLGEAIRSLNLRNRQQLTMTDAALEKRRYAGVVSGWDPQAFAQTVALQLGLQAVTVGDTTYLTPRPSEVDESTATESER